MKIADLSVHGPDRQGDKVLAFYALNPPEYAVYRTSIRVVVQYADDPGRAAQQRKALSTINPLRGEINGLIDGWRTPDLSGSRISHRASLNRRAERYDRRVGDSLTLALEDDIGGAALLLREIKQDLVDERTSWGRFEYLLAALATGLGLFLVTVAMAWLAGWIDPPRPGDIPAQTLLAWAAAAGELGAFFSICLGIRSRTVLPDLQRLANITDAALRMVVGAIGATVVMAFLDAKVIRLDFGGAQLSGANTPQLYAFIAGFVAGFSERFVPDLLAKVSTSSTSASMPPGPSAPASSPKAIASVPASATVAPTAQVVENDPLPHLAAEDGCTHGGDLPDALMAKDKDLPPATGGVAAS